MKQVLLSLHMTFIVFGLSLFGLTTSTVYADDIEIYGAANAQNPPVNVMFIFDLSGSMLATPDGQPTPSGSGLSRREILLEALTNVLEGNKEKESLRVGFTWFNTWRQGISYPATSISADLHDLDPAVPADSYYVYSQIPRELGQIYVAGSYLTNIVGSLYETAKYYRGGEVSGWRGYRPPEWHNGFYNYDYSPHGLSYTPNPGPDVWTAEGNKRWGTCSYGSTCKPSFTRYPDRLQVNNCRWTTPSAQCIDWRCENTGTENQSCRCHAYGPGTSYHICAHEYWQEAWLGATYNSPIEDSCQASYIVLLSDGEPTTTYDEWSIESQIINDQCADIPGLDAGKCGPELVEYLANNDQIDNISGSKVFTYTIGFNVSGLGKDYLETLAEKGQGVFYSASNATDLEDAFKQILASITGENESFSSAVSSISPSTLSSDNRVFLNMFKPGNTRSWKGNTKGYFVDSTGFLDVDGKPAIVIDEEDNVDKYKDDARSFWSNSSDGNFVEIGGASDELKRAQSRTLYTYTGTESPAHSALTEITIDESTISPDLFNASNDAEKEEIINWLRNDVGMGDPLHSKPLLISYEDSHTNTKKDVLFTMTNQGLLHAFDATYPMEYGDYNGGNELFAFIPQALLAKLKDHKANLNSSKHLYGLDGVLSYYHEDINNDRVVNNSEKIYLYFGMRRGGRNYYALDVSNLASPTLQWRIEGGTGDYAQLGQTWSRLTPTSIKWGSSTEKKVVIFGGGYDEKQDDKTLRTADTMGNAVYIADALTGARLWHATKGTAKIDTGNHMKYSIPSDITVIDTNYDKLADRLYFGDMGGQVWRINLVNSDNNKAFKGQLFANLATNNEMENTRRFYSPPEVAKMKSSTGFYYAVAIGSGFRAHPISPTVNDSVFVIKDTNTSTGTSNASATIIKENLLNITNMLDADNISEAISNKKGWQLDLEGTGEKSLTNLLIFDSQLGFSTFTPANDGDTSLTCGGGGGEGLYYQVNLEDGTPNADFYDSNTNENNLTKESRWMKLPGHGISPDVVRQFGIDGYSTQERVGTTIVGGTDEKVHKINWKKLN